MAKGKKHTPEQIVSLLRQIEVAVANGKTTPIACREGGITEQTYYRWRKEFGGLQVDQARRLKELVQKRPGTPLCVGIDCEKTFSATVRALKKTEPGQRALT